MFYCKFFLYAWLLILVAALPAAATVLTWDADTGTFGVQDGSGTWSTGGNNWWNGTANQAWANGDSALIGNASITTTPTVTVSGTVSLGGLTMASNGQPTAGPYTVTGGTLSFSDGSTIYVDQPRDLANSSLPRTKINSAIAGPNVTISSHIASAATVNDSGFLELGGTNTNTGTLTLSSNVTVFMFNATALSSGVTGITINPGATLDLDYTGTVNTPITLNSLGATNGTTIGILPTHAAPITGNAGALRLGYLSGAQEFNSPVTFTGDSEIQAGAAGGNIVNLNAIGGNLTSAYHLTLRTNQGTTMNVNRAINVKSLGLQSFWSSSSGGATINVNQPITASDLFVTPYRLGKFVINAPITLNTAAGSGKMTAESGYTSIDTFQINATITAPGGVEFQKGMITATGGVELNSASGFALDTPEIKFTPGAGGANALVVAKRDDQVSHNALLTFQDTGITRTFRLEGHTAYVSGIQTTGTFATASQAVIQNNLANTTGTLTIDNAADYTYAGTIQNGTGPGSLLALVKKGAGRLSLQGTTAAGNTGGTTVEAGTLDLTMATINATGYKLTLNGGTVDFGSTNMGLLTITGGTATSSVGSTVTSNVNYEVQGGNVAVALGDAAGLHTGLNKTGPGTATLSAFQTYTGKTTIGGGTLKLTGSGKIDYSSVVELQNGAIFDVSEFSGYTSGMQTIQGSGTISGGFTTGYGATLAPGVLKTAQTLAFANGLTLASGANLKFDLASTAAGVSDKINVSGNLNVGDFNTFNVNVGVVGSSVQFNTPYTVLTYTGSLSGSSYSFSTATNTTRLIYTTALDSIGKKLTVTATGGTPKSLTWSATTSPSDWDLIASYNWKEGTTSQQFYDLDAVTFGDGFAGMVNLTTTVRPGTINVTATQDYEFSGYGAISGEPIFTKSGSGTLTISNANDFTSDLTVNAGTLKVNNAAALGTTAGKTRLSGTGVLDVNGLSLSDEEIVVESGSSAKVVNSLDNVTLAQDAIRYLTLNGDVTVGGQFYWSMRNRVNPGVGTYLAGNGHKITKVDANNVTLSDLGETGLGDIDIQAGSVTVQRSTTLGDPSGTVSVASNASLWIYASTLNYNKKINLADTAKLVSDHTSNATISGVVTLTGGTATIDLTGDKGTNFLKFTGDVTGPGGITLTGPPTSILTFDGPKSYTGNTLLSSGILSLTGSGAMDSAVVTVNTTLNVINGDHTLKAIDGTGTVNVATAASLTATSISTATLTIGGTFAAAVPEPATWLILLTAGFAIVAHRLSSRRRS